MAVTLTGTIRTAANELAEGTVTISSVGASTLNGELIVGDTSGPITLDQDGKFEVPWVPQITAEGEPATVTITFALTNATNPAPMTVALQQTDGSVNVLTLPKTAPAPGGVSQDAYLTESMADNRYLTEGRLGASATYGPAPTGGGSPSTSYGIAPLDSAGLVPVTNLLDLAGGFAPGTALAYSSDVGRLVPIRVDDRFRGYVTAPPTEAGQVGDFFRNAVVSTDGAFVREWVCAGGTQWLAIVVNRSGDVTTPPTNAWTFQETFSTDGLGWGPDLPWSFPRGAGSRVGGRGLMSGGVTVPTIARMDTALTSANHAVRLTWVDTPDGEDRSVGVCTRMHATNEDFYVFEVNKSLQRFSFQKIATGDTVWTSGFQTLPMSVDVPLTMELRSKSGGVHECLVNDVLVATYSIADPNLDSNVHIGAWQWNGDFQVPVDNISARVLGGTP